MKSGGELLAAPGRQWEFVETLLVFLILSLVPACAVFALARRMKGTRATKRALYEYVVAPLAERDPAGWWGHLAGDSVPPPSPPAPRRGRQAFELAGSTWALSDRQGVPEPVAMAMASANRFRG
jgi:hypothetical protein